MLRACKLCRETVPHLRRDRTAAPPAMPADVAGLSLAAASATSSITPASGCAGLANRIAGLAHLNRAAGASAQEDLQRHTLWQQSVDDDRLDSSARPCAAAWRVDTLLCSSWCPAGCSPYKHGRSPTHKWYDVESSPVSDKLVVYLERRPLMAEEKSGDAERWPRAGGGGVAA